ncbi:Arylsulfatase A [Hyunsoonleella jejuensis]|uniref:Arylsulfatase A n=1 Tax=Hyunsoonleella jejuensis TaxID=419940 RepID=A0A1H9DKK9_9FLAO|nr:sulfatase [Hyunsoonleella jejuensis]SEQ13994.1 Arylsulfatase A [Hyunsoonleella jejuensis]
MNLIKRFAFIILVLLFGCKTQQSNLKQTTETEQPNILIIHVDDLGYHDLSGHGSKIYQTPNIDALEKASISFTNAYANYPRCVPSRYAMMTGNYPVQNGNVPDDGFKLNNTPDNKNFVKQFKASGYQTAYFGKWHLGGEGSLKDFGYDYSFGAGHAGSPISFLYPFNVFKGKGKTKKSPIPDVDNVSKEGDYLMDVMTDNVIKYIKNADKNKPFMAMFSFYAVHQPLEAKQKDIQRNKEEIKNFDFGNQPEFIPEGTGRTKMRQNHPKYAAMVETMDENVGKLLQTLKDLNIEDNTIVIFSSDHGGLSNDGYNKRDLATTNYPLRAGKGWLYDGGIKVPLLVKWNGKFQPRTDNESIIMLMDVFPTLTDITSKADLKTDGKSFLPVLKGEENWKDRTVFWHSSKARPKSTGDTKSSSIRKGDFKLINWYKEGRTELYNIVNDPSESKDISEDNPKLTQALLGELNTWKSNF